MRYTYVRLKALEQDEKIFEMCVPRRCCVHRSLTSWVIRKRLTIHALHDDYVSHYGGNPTCIFVGRRRNLHTPTPQWDFLPLSDATETIPCLTRAGASTRTCMYRNVALAVTPSLVSFFVSQRMYFYVWEIWSQVNNSERQVSTPLDIYHAQSCAIDDGMQQPLYLVAMYVPVYRQTLPPRKRPTCGLRS